MQTVPVTRQHLLGSVIAVPPLARHADLSLNREANRAIFRHIEAGGVTTFLYGGNANFYHIRLSEFGAALDLLAEEAGENSLVIPSVGPCYGTMMDQVPVLKGHAFPTVMVLPMQGVLTDDGVATGFRHFVEAFGRPSVLYLKDEGYLRPATAAKLVRDGLVSFIKYAIVREDPARDAYLTELLALIGGDLVVSGIGEQPAIVHVRDFGLTGYTSGCVCIAPDLSRRMLLAIQSGAWREAEEIREIFRPLEDLRNSIHPIRVLHEAVSLAGIADTGELLPLMSRVAESDRAPIAAAAKTLLASGTRVLS
jgi:dihydrodipicolinate synthase/N-acetylneuraminate lyase